MHFVATTTDHVAPWKSVYKIHRLAPNCDLTFLLTTGGHNAGIVSGPDHPRRSYQVTTRAGGEAYIAPDRWAAETPVPARFLVALLGWLAETACSGRAAQTAWDGRRPRRAIPRWRTRPAPTCFSYSGA